MIYEDKQIGEKKPKSYFAQETMSATRLLYRHHHHLLLLFFLSGSIVMMKAQPTPTSASSYVPPSCDAIIRDANALPQCQQDLLTSINYTVDSYTERFASDFKFCIGDL